MKHNTPDLGTLIADLLVLMNRYIRSADEAIFSDITRQLTQLSCHPECDSEELKAIAHKLAKTWRQEQRLNQLNHEHRYLHTNLTSKLGKIH